MRQVALRRESLADQAAVAIERMIVDGALGPGDPLPSTGELAERFEVSRTVVREALAALAGRGLVVRRQGRESVVADPGARQLRQLLELYVRRSGASADVMAELWRGLEAEGARLAPARITDEQRRHLRALLDVPSDPAGPAHDGGRDFHRGVLAASRNPVLPLLVDVLSEPADDRPLAGTGGCGATGGPRTGHLAILEAIERGDADAAADAMRQHLSGPDTGLNTGPNAGPA